MCCLILETIISMQRKLLALYIITVLQLAASVSIPFPTVNTPQHFSFSFKTKGQSTFMLDPTLVNQHITGQLWLCKADGTAPSQPAKLFIKRNSLQVVSVREVTNTTDINFIAEPEREYAVSVESVEEVLCRVSIREYARGNTGVRVFPKDSQVGDRVSRLLQAVQELESGEMEETAKVGEEIIRKMVTEKIISLVETIAIVIVMFVQMNYLKTLIDSSRRLI